MIKEKTIDQLIRETWMNIAKLYNEEASKYGGTLSIGYVLLKLNPEAGTQSTNLATMLGMEVTSLSRTLKKMENKNLIYKEPHPKDGRGILINLTEYGKEMRNKSRETVLKFNEVVSSNIDKKDLKCFSKVLLNIQSLLNEKKIF